MVRPRDFCSRALPVESDLLGRSGHRESEVRPFESSFLPCHSLRIFSAVDNSPPSGWSWGRVTTWLYF